MRVLALTGVPGTGKSTVARLVEGAAVVEANELARSLDAIEGEDEHRGATVVDEGRLARLGSEALPEGRVIIEGHLAHHCPCDAVVLLRCHPRELRQRLAEREWPAAKVEENVMAETLDALVPEIEAERAGEIDTTDLSAEQTAAKVEGLFNGEPFDSPWVDPLGTADWTGTLTGEDEA